MLRTMEYLLLACLLQAFSRSEPNLCTYMFRQKKNVEKYIKIVGYSFPMFSQNTLNLKIFLASIDLFLRNFKMKGIRRESY